MIEYTPVAPLGRVMVMLAELTCPQFDDITFDSIRNAKRLIYIENQVIEFDRSILYKSVRSSIYIYVMQSFMFWSLVMVLYSI